MEQENIQIAIPDAIDNLALPNPSLLAYYIDRKNRTIWIDDQINVYTLDVVREILRWNRADRRKPIEKRKPIKLLIMSPGGSLDICYTLIDTISLSKTPIYGINMGVAASAAAFIFLSCHKRFMMPRAYFLLHKGSANLNGSYLEVAAAMQDYQLQIEELTKIVKMYTKYSEEEIEDRIMGEWYIRKDEALEKGVVEGVIEDIENIL